eukprot:3185626-Pyramimonas_sp.AAC.1
MFGAPVMQGGMHVDVVRTRRTSRSSRGWSLDRTAGTSRDSSVIRVKSSCVGNTNRGIMKMIVRDLNCVYKKGLHLRSRLCSPGYFLLTSRNMLMMACTPFPFKGG